MILEVDGQKFAVITTAQGVRTLIGKISKSKQCHALDFETTGLDPETSKVRLTAIFGPAGGYVIDHWKAGPVGDFARDLSAACVWYVFNSKFEGRWFDYATEGPHVQLFDVGHMHKAKYGGGWPHSLAQLTDRVLGKKRDNKALQTSDWNAKVLTPEQYCYAFEDTLDTYLIGDQYQQELTLEQWTGFRVINDAWRGTAEMEDTGMCLDIPYHKTLIAMWERRRKAAERVLRQYTPEHVIPNIRSKKQLSDFIRSTLDTGSGRGWPQTAKGQLSTTRQTLKQASFRAPYPFSRWLAALMVFNRADKYLSTYGENLINKAMLSPDKRIHGRLNIAAAITGRYSSSNPNLQNIPRSKVVRRSFVAPAGAVMVVADYSGVELRVLAEMSNDAQLKQDVIYGNVHAESAITLYDLSAQREDFMASLKDPNHPHYSRNVELRSKSKAFSFQLTYGAGYGALAVVLRCSDDEAGEFVAKWAERYPAAYNYRHRMFDVMNTTGFLHCASGRTIHVSRNDRTMPVASNYPIQGSAGDVMYRAITRMSVAVERCNYNVRMLNTVHDELLLLVEPDFVDDAKAMLEREMKEAWLDIFPGTSTDNLVEAGSGPSWAEAK